MKESVMKELSLKLLHAAERFFLYAHGWTSDSNGMFYAPANYEFRKRPSYNQGHAVNSQKQAYGKHEE